jgi:hypothetical protein
VENGHDLSNEPRVRLRVAHKRTAKSGWELSDTTVELTAPLAEGAAAISPLLEGYLGEVYLLGAREAARRNKEETP